LPIPVVAALARQSERLGTYSTSSQVVGAIRDAAAATGVSFNVLATKAAMESGLKSNAQAPTSSARGLFQFIDQTWLSMVQQHGAEHGLGAEAAAITTLPGGRLSVQNPAERTRILALRDNPELSARFAGEYLKQVSDSLTPVLGRRPDATELYLGHFLGTSGAAQMLKAQASNPDQAASAVLPAAAAANPRMFTGTDGQPLSIGQFTSRVRNRLERVYAELGLDAPSGSVDLQPGSEPAVTRSAAGEPGSWGNGTPARMARTAERTIIADLTRVFSRMNRSAAAHGTRHDSSQGLPAAVVSPLRPDARVSTTPQT
jgi:hypothetical protein